MIESQVEAGLGRTATVLVQRGTLAQVQYSTEQCRDTLA